MVRGDAFRRHCRHFATFWHPHRSLHPSSRSEVDTRCWLTRRVGARVLPRRSVSSSSTAENRAPSHRAAGGGRRRLWPGSLGAWPSGPETPPRAVPLVWRGLAHTLLRGFCACRQPRNHRLALRCHTLTRLSRRAGTPHILGRRHHGAAVRRRFARFCSPRLEAEASACIRSTDTRKEYARPDGLHPPPENAPFCRLPRFLARDPAITLLSSTEAPV